MLRKPSLFTTLLAITACQGTATRDKDPATMTTPPPSTPTTTPPTTPATSELAVAPRAAFIANMQALPPSTAVRLALTARTLSKGIGYEYWLGAADSPEAWLVEVDDTALGISLADNVLHHCGRVTPCMVEVEAMWVDQPPTLRVIKVLGPWDGARAPFATRL